MFQEYFHSAYFYGIKDWLLSFLYSARPFPQMQQLKLSLTSHTGNKVASRPLLRKYNPISLPRPTTSDGGEPSFLPNEEVSYYFNMQLKPTNLQKLHN